MPSIVDDTINPGDIDAVLSRNQCAFMTPDGNLIVFYIDYVSGGKVYYKISGDNGKTWGEKFILNQTAITTSRENSYCGHMDDDGNILLAHILVTSGNYNVRIIRMDYDGYGIWNVVGETVAYSGGRANQIDITRESGGRAWLVVRERIPPSSTWGNLLALRSDDLTNWTTHTLESTTNRNVGRNPHITIRDQYPVVTYYYKPSTTHHLSAREWNGSSFNSRVNSASQTSGVGINHQTIKRGTTVYCVAEGREGPSPVRRMEWSGTGWLAGSLHNGQATAGDISLDADGRTHIAYTLYSEDGLGQPDAGRKRIIMSSFFTAVFSHKMLYSNYQIQGIDNVSPQVKLVKNRQIKNPVAFFVAMTSSAPHPHDYSLMCITHSFDRGIKISLPGKDVNKKIELADDVNDFSLHSGYPNLKIKSQAKVSVNDNTTFNVNHNLPYPPIVWCFILKSGQLHPVYDAETGVHFARMYVDWEKLYIRNDDGGTRDFYYYIFHDEM